MDLQAHNQCQLFSNEMAWKTMRGKIVPDHVARDFAHFHILSTFHP